MTGAGYIGDRGGPCTCLPGYSIYAASPDLYDGHTVVLPEQDAGTLEVMTPQLASKSTLVCAKCGTDTYKSSVGVETCTPCPRNAGSTSLGNTDVTACQVCLYISRLQDSDSMLSSMYLMCVCVSE